MVLRSHTQEGARLPRPDAVSAKLPGPGLPESVCWLALLVLVQLVGTVVVVVPLLWTALGWPTDVERVDAWITAVSSPPYDAITDAAAILVPVLLLGPLVILRVGRRDFRKKLELRAPRAGHALLAFGAVIPLTVFSGGIFEWAMTGWRRLAERTPALEGLESLSSMSALDGSLATVPVTLLLVVLAVGPAVLEELVFRGLIGRGLVARWGVPAGVVWTSLLFAAVHVFPPHVVAVFPVGVFLHVVYLATRSLKLVIGLHFANNALALVSVRYGLGEGHNAGVPLVLASGWVVLLLTSLLWVTRRADDGTLCSPIPRLAWVRPATAAALLAFTGLFLASS